MNAEEWVQRRVLLRGPLADSWALVNGGRYLVPVVEYPDTLAVDSIPSATQPMLVWEDTGKRQYPNGYACPGFRIFEFRGVSL